MGRIITSGDGAIHVGGRVRPAQPHRFALHDPRYGLDLSAWPATPPATRYGEAPEVQELLADPLGNDRLGLCTEADQYKRQGVRQSAGGRPVYHPPLEQVVAAYARDGGYTGDPSTDRGCDETVVLANARDIGIVCDASGAFDRIAAYMVVEPSNRDLVRACVTMFVGGACCAELAEEWLASAAPGGTWDVPKGGYKPVAANGHCFTLLDQDEQGLSISTWGRKLRLTYDALAACAASGAGGALFFALDAQVLSQSVQAAPDGLDWVTLVQDFNALPSTVIDAPGP